VNDYRIHKFKLDQFVDSLSPLASCTSASPTRTSFGLRGHRQVPVRQVIYIETPDVRPGRPGLGIRSILHTDFKSTCAKVASFGLLNEGALHETANPRILTINGGSSSIKFALYQAGEPLKRGLHGTVDRIGLSGTT